MLLQLQKKSWQEERESLVGYPTEDIQVLNRWSELAFFRKNGYHGGVRGARGGAGKNHPSPLGRIYTAELGLREGDQVSTTTPPNQDRQRQRGGRVGVEITD